MKELILVCVVGVTFLAYSSSCVAALDDPYDLVITGPQAQTQESVSKALSDSAALQMHSYLSLYAPELLNLTQEGITWNIGGVAHSPSSLTQALARALRVLSEGTDPTQMTWIGRELNSTTLGEDSKNWVDWGLTHDLVRSTWGWTGPSCGCGAAK